MIVGLLTSYDDLMHYVGKASMDSPRTSAFSIVSSRSVIPAARGCLLDILDRVAIGPARR